MRDHWWDSKRRNRVIHMNAVLILPLVMLAGIGGMKKRLDLVDELEIRGRRGNGPAVGTEAPDFELARLKSEAKVKLSQFRGDKPVALVFGSYT